MSVIGIHDELVGVEHYGTEDYFVMMESTPPSSGREVALFREEANGLFVRLLSDTYAQALDDVAVTVGGLPTTVGHREAHDRAVARLSAKVALARWCAAVPAPHLGIGVDEQWLAYPLFVGARWRLSESPLVECTVTARERVRVPAGTTLAWRVRTTREWFGDGDRIETWYSAAGLVRWRTRIEEDITDFQGNVVGSLEYEADQSLTAFHLEDLHPRRVAVAP